jgi:Derlin-2/3
MRLLTLGIGLLTSVTVWYYLSDIYPPTHGNHRPLDPPRLWVRLWEGAPEPEVLEEDVEPTDGEVRRELGARPIPELQ